MTAYLTGTAGSTIPYRIPFPVVGAAGYGDDEAAMVQYRAEGTERALAMDNRGPIHYTDDGRVDPSIVEAYRKYGFYVFTDVIDPVELTELEDGIIEMLAGAPVAPKATVDVQGRPAISTGLEARTFGWVKPLSDPVGGTSANFGRHPAKMIEPGVPDGSPDRVIMTVLGSLQFSPALLRLYGHPDLLSVVAAINGDDFVPFNEAMFIKAPRLGGSVAWHQDGWTHWDSPDLDWGTHGFNLMAQLYGCDAANGLWVIPGSHDGGRADIAAMVAEAGSDRLPDAVPVVTKPGDVAITNRQAIHGSFANTSPNPRVSIGMGFHRRASVLDVTSGGIHNPVTTYTADHIDRRSAVIQLAIDARAQRFPYEARFAYQPFVGREDDYRWSPDRQADLADYNLRDLGI